MAQYLVVVTVNFFGFWVALPSRIENQVNLIELKDAG